MAKKSEKKQTQEPVTEPVAPVKEKEKTPVASPAAKVMQLTPIVQPIAFVPYSSQEQPLYMYDEEEPAEEFEDVEIEAQPVEEAAAPAKKKSASVAGIFVAIFSLLLIAVYCLPKIDAISAYLMPYVGFDLGNGAEVANGLDVVINFFTTLDYTNIIALALTVVPVCTVLTLIACLIRICHKGVCVFAKITVFFALLASLVAIIAALVADCEVNAGFGYYIVVGISFINLLIAYLAKKD